MQGLAPGQLGGKPKKMKSMFDSPTPERKGIMRAVNYSLSMQWIFGKIVSVLLECIDPHQHEATGYEVNATKA